MKYLIILFITFLVLFSFTQKESTIKSLHHEETILAFGDSLTYGFSAKLSESYPTVLSNLTGLKVINAGINGETSSQGLRRLAAHLEDNSIKLMILCFGGNDIIQRLPWII